MSDYRERDNDSPFGASDRPVVRYTKGIVYLLVLAAAAAGVYYKTRGHEATDTASTGHEHHGMAVSGDSAQPVMLTADQEHRIGVTWAVASMQPLNREIRTAGQVTVDETKVRIVSTRVDGWVEQLFVDFTGQDVAAGAPLLALYSPMLVAAQEELLLAVRLQREVASASEEAQQHGAGLVAAARRRLEFWNVPVEDIARIERDGEVQRTILIRATIAGFATVKNVIQGQKVAAGEALYQIADLSTVWVEGEVFEQDLAAVRVGQQVTAGLQARPGQEYSGRISYIYPTLNPETHTARVRVELPNPGVRIKPGMFATLRMTGLETPNAVTVPRSAVLLTGQRNVVFLKRADGMLEPREVVVGQSGDSRIEILRGLTVGDTVAASATFLIDAESSLGSAMGGMGDMPGMDMTAPNGGNGSAAKKGAVPVSKPDPDHSGHDAPHSGAEND